METRINVYQIQPEAYTALLALEKYFGTTSLSPGHKELIKIRASQINGCAYCINMHTKGARKAGETEQRIYALNAWRDTDFYTPEERVLLAITEEVTLISQAGLTEKTYQEAVKLFDETYLAQIIMAVITINAWNRLAISTLIKPEKDK